MHKTLNVKTWLLLAVTSALFGCSSGDDGYFVDHEIPLVQETSDVNLKCGEFAVEIAEAEAKIQKARTEHKFNLFSNRMLRANSELRIKHLEQLKADKDC